MKTNIKFAGMSLTDGVARFHTAIRGDTCLSVPLPGTVTYTMVQLPNAMTKLEALNFVKADQTFKAPVYQKALDVALAKLTPKPKVEKPAKVKVEKAVKAKTVPAKKADKPVSAAVEKFKKLAREANKEVEAEKIAAKKK